MTLTPSHDIEALVKRLQDRCVTLSQKNRELEQALAEAREALSCFERLDIRGVVKLFNISAAQAEIGLEHGFIYRQLTVPPAPENRWPEGDLAKKLYLTETSNHPQIHCNRFPSWDELTSEEKQSWVDRALNTHPDTMNDESPRRLTEGSINA